MTRFYLRTMADFPVQLNSVYVYPIQEYDALKTWMNKVPFPPRPCYYGKFSH